jgi:histidinol-phosphate aminotransferase
MKESKVSRRNWLKMSSLVMGGLVFGKLPAFGTPALGTNRAGKLQITSELSPSNFAMPELRARLLANENPFGPSPKAKEVLKNCIDLSFRYPWAEFEKCKEMIAEKEGVKPKNIILSAGSTDILYGAALAFGQGATKILSADITYMDLLERAQNLGATIDVVPLTNELDYDLEAMQKKASNSHSLVYLVNPNNPTGKSIDPKKLKTFCDNVSPTVPVFIDEAYIDFMDDMAANSMVSCVKEGKNVLVTRTFSKLHAFAGLRMGYAIGLPETIEKIEKYTTGQRSITYPTVHAAMASYTDTEFLKYSKAEILKSKEFLYKTLEDAGYTYVNSDANFVLFPLKFMKADRFVEEMFKEGVGVRNWSFRDKEWCRVSMGTMEEMKIFAKVFEKLS